MDLSTVQRCLDVIETDCQLSDTSVDAVRQAKQHIDSCVQAHAAASDAVSSRRRLQTQSDSLLTDSDVSISYIAVMMIMIVSCVMIMVSAVWRMLLLSTQTSSGH